MILANRLPIAIVALPMLFAAAGERRGITPEDYYAFKHVIEARVSPDGKLAAYIVQSVEEKRNRRRSSILLMPTDGSSPGTSIGAGAAARSPKWSPDGKSLAYLEVGQIFVLPIPEGKARKVTDFKGGFESFEWSPAGDGFVCVAKTGPTRGPDSSDVRHITSITYKMNGSGWYDDRRNHIFVVSAATGEAKQISSRPDFNDTDPRWSPDGTKIVFSSRDTTRRADNNSSIWVVPSDGGDLVKISDVSGEGQEPRWSPDGKRIAYLGSPDGDDLLKIHIAPATGGASVLGSQHLELEPETMEWFSDRCIFFEAGVRGETQIFKLDPQTQAVTQVTSGHRYVHHAAFSHTGGIMTYLSNDPQHMDELYAAEFSEEGASQGEKKLTDTGRELFDKLDLQGVETFTYKGADGWPIDGFLMKPAGWEPGKKYPMVLAVHGGPKGMYGYHWSQDFQLMAANGWAVMFTNPRGSTGYGDKFHYGVIQQFGGKAYEDIMKGVDAALARYSWIDPARLGVTGGSFGGYMTNWVVGHTTRFKAAISICGMSDFISNEGTRDIAYGHTHYFLGNVFDQFQLFWDSSPLKYARQVKTPILLITAENDQRVPMTQVEEWFRALKHYGATTELLVFPRENHSLGSAEPKHIIDRLNWQSYWFKRYLDGNASVQAPH